MTANKIHPTACIDPGAELDGVEAGAFVVVEAGAQIGRGTVLYAHSVVKSHSRIGKDNRIFEGAIIGAEAQDLGYKQGSVTTVEIGDGNVFREGVTAHRGTVEGSVTRIGSNCFFMANSHIAHNCIVGDSVILANGALLAGYAQVGDKAFISGNVGVHQKVRVGRMAMIGAVSKLTQDAPPFSMIQGVPGVFQGLNLVGLRRAGVTAEDRAEIKRIYTLIYSGGSLQASIQTIRNTYKSALALEIIEFLSTSERGIILKSLSGRPDLEKILPADL